MILTSQYFQKPHSQQQERFADDLLSKVNGMCLEAKGLGVFDFANDPDTGCPISGSQGGDGDGGFRSPGTRTGASGSPHRKALAVDVYDPSDKLDSWLDNFEDGQGGNSKLEAYGLFREHPDWTKGGWVHLQSVPPASQKRTFQP